MGTPEDKVSQVRARFEASRFHGWVGMRLQRLVAGEADISLEIRPEHLNLMGSLHGGVIGSLADTATGIAMHAALDHGWTHVTTSIQVTYLAPGRIGDTVVARGRVVRRGRRFGYAEADVERSDGTLVARGTASFLVQEERDERQ